MIIYTSLVRDRIPEVIAQDGKTCSIRKIQDRDELMALLDRWPQTKRAAGSPSEGEGRLEPIMLVEQDVIQDGDTVGRKELLVIVARM